MANKIDIEALLASLPIDNLAAQLDAKPEAVRDAASLAIPGLLGGLAKNSASPKGAQNLGEALKDHDIDFKSIRVEDVDVKDGKKIVEHVFGEKEETVTAAIATGAGSGEASSIVPKLLPLLAPLVMAYLAKNLFGTGGPSTQQTPPKKGQPKQAPQGSDLTDLLGGLLGGSKDGKGGKGGPLGDLGMLGDLLGGGSQSQKQSPIGSILGSLFGK